MWWRVPFAVRVNGRPRNNNRVCFYKALIVQGGKTGYRVPQGFAHAGHSCTVLCMSSLQGTQQSNGGVLSIPACTEAGSVQADAHAWFCSARSIIHRPQVGRGNHGADASTASLQGGSCFTGRASVKQGGASSCAGFGEVVIVRSGTIARLLTGAATCTTSSSSSSESIVITACWGAALWRLCTTWLDLTC